MNEEAVALDTQPSYNNYGKYEVSRELGIPEYLQETYWWAYLHPTAVNLFERQWLVNLILWSLSYQFLGFPARALRKQPCHASPHDLHQSNGQHRKKASTKKVSTKLKFELHRHGQNTVTNEPSIPIIELLIEYAAERYARFG